MLNTPILLLAHLSPESSSSKNFKFTSIPHPKVSTAPIANKEIAVSYIQKGYQHYVKTGSIGVLSS